MNYLKELLFQEKDIKKRFYLLIKILRENCEWDKKQTFESLREALIEESYEVAHGMDKQNKQILQEELGDLLFLTHFIIYLSEEKNFFSLDDIYESTITKLVERHPHVFGDEKTNDTTKILKKWESFKNKKLGEDTEYFPALLRANKIQKKVALEGFDWQKKEKGEHLFEILNTVHEELKELEDELRKYIVKQSQNQREKLEMELGDILFSIVNLARHLSLSSELALQKSIDKFIKRWNMVWEEYQKNHKNYMGDKIEILEEIYKKIKQKTNEDI